MITKKHRKIVTTIFKFYCNIKRGFFNMKRNSVSNLSFHYVIL